MKRGWLDPTSATMQRWDLATMICLFYTAFVTPYEVSFMGFTDQPIGLLFSVNQVVNIIFIVRRAARARPWPPNAPPCRVAVPAP